MATSWRSISYSPVIKLLAILLTLSGALLACYGMLQTEHLELAFEPEGYSESLAKKSTLNQAKHAVIQIAEQLHNEEFITSGQSNAALLQDENSLSNRLQRELQELSDHYESYIEAAESNGRTDEVNRLTAERDSKLEARKNEVEKKWQRNREDLIALDLSVYRSLREFLDEPNSYLYYAPITGGDTLQNIGAVADLDAYFSALPAHIKHRLTDGSTAYVGLTAEKYAVLADRFRQDRALGVTAFYQVLTGAGMFLLGLGYIMFSAGRRPQSDEVQLHWVDGLYLDVGAAILLGVAYFYFILMMQLLPSYWQLPVTPTLVLGATATVLMVLLGLLYASTLAKRIKRGELFRHTLCFAVLNWAFASVKRFWSNSVRPFIQAGPLAIRLSGLLLAYGLANVIAICGLGSPLGIGLWLVTNAAMLLFVSRKVSMLHLITAGAERVRSGELGYRIPLDGNKELATLAQSVNNIADGLSKAVEREVKAERMKAELITNVSHDLRTPLTSLITYIDLLKQEGLTSEHAMKYLDILDQKTQRLKTLTEGLIEAAKAASGNMTVRLEQLDMGALLTQGLGELAEQIEASGLDFRVSCPETKLYVQADGRLLWRVLENLLQNILKYALPESRVYVVVTEQAEQVVLTLKNISAEPLNIEPSELLERFKRGDESRHGEGSGLGLSIAKSLTELQNGSFDIEIDGDLFKTTVVLPRAKQEQGDVA